MINPYRHTPSARPTKISDLPKALGSSLIAPKAALAALATAIPPPTQESPVDNAAARYPSPVAIPASEPALCCLYRICDKHHHSGDHNDPEEEKSVKCNTSFITFLCFSLHEENNQME